MTKKTVYPSSCPVVSAGYLESFPYVKEEYIGLPLIFCDSGEHVVFVLSFFMNSPAD